MIQLIKCLEDQPESHKTKSKQKGKEHDLIEKVSQRST